MEHIYESIGEGYPYLFELDKLIINQSSVEYTTTSSENQFKEFKKIGQTAATLASISLLQDMRVFEKTFFLAEKIRIRKISNTTMDQELRYCARTVCFSERKGKVLLDIFDNQSQLVYTSELEYVIFNQNAFQQVFSGFYTQRIPVKNDLVYQEVEIDLGKPAHFSIDIPAFTIEHCKGHFDNYPIVPGIFIVGRLLEGIEKFFKLHDKEFQNKTLVVDNLETFLKTATPINIPLQSLVTYYQVSRDSYLFICPVGDKNTEYGYYIITIKLY